MAAGLSAKVTIFVQKVKLKLLLLKFWQLTKNLFLKFYSVLCQDKRSHLSSSIHLCHLSIVLARKNMCEHLLELQYDP